MVNKHGARGNCLHSAIMNQKTDLRSVEALLDILLESKYVEEQSLCAEMTSVCPVLISTKRATSLSTYFVGQDPEEEEEEGDDFDEDEDDDDDFDEDEDDDDDDDDFDDDDSDGDDDDSDEDSDEDEE